jgi:hypothetical protein
MTDPYHCFRKFDCFVNIIAELFVFHRKHRFATTIFVHNNVGNLLIMPTFRTFPVRNHIV